MLNILEASEGDL